MSSSALPAESTEDDRTLSVTGIQSGVSTIQDNEAEETSAQSPSPHRATSNELQEAAEETNLVPGTGRSQQSEDGSRKERESTNKAVGEGSSHREDGETAKGNSEVTSHDSDSKSGTESRSQIKLPYRSKIQDSNKALVTSADTAPDAAQGVAEDGPSVASPPPPAPPPKDEKYQSGNVNAVRVPPIDTRGKDIVRNYDEYGKELGGSEDAHDDSKSEIQSIMEQFDEGMNAPGVDEIMSPRLEIAGPKIGSPVSHPPRKSSLEPLQAKNIPQFSEGLPPDRQNFSSPPPRSTSLKPKPSQLQDAEKELPNVHTSPPRARNSIFKPPPPEPDSDLPFDFHRFLEQLRHKTADPVARFLRSFLSEFGKKQWMVHEQVKIISDFLEFISRKMAQCEVWRVVSDAEFENAKEGMEKLVMNRLYAMTFSPAIPAPEPASKGRRRGQQNTDAHGRRGQHQEDVERDEVLAQKVRIYQWVNEKHLDIPEMGDKGRKFLQLAQQELLKIKSYRAPRDKVICVLNCCKVIFGFLRNQQTDTSADSFVPLLIYTVLQANPEHLVSNVQYILRFRNQDKLTGEAGYYMSSLMGAVQFVENIDRTSLTISDEEFEKNVEAAVSAIAERHQAQSEDRSSQASLDPERQGPSIGGTPGRTPGHQRRASPHVHISEKSSLALAEVTPRNSLDAERVPPRRSTSLRNQSETGGPSNEMDSEDNAAVAGLLRTIRSPLSTIGRIFSDDNGQSQQQSSHPVMTPQPGSTPARLSPSEAGAQQRRRNSADGRTQQMQSAQQLQQVQRMSAEDAAARQASAETEEARKIQAKEFRVVLDTIINMFPNLDREVIEDIVQSKQGRVGDAVDACLALGEQT